MLRFPFSRVPLMLAPLSLTLSAMLGAADGDTVFAKDVRPVLDEFCLKCHSTAKHKGDFDLEQNASPAGIRKHPKAWQMVLEHLDDGEMPPKEKPQPSAAQKTLLSEWTRSSLQSIARERAGDPGPVVLRRLSNAEYTYSIRDLTGVSSLDPAKEFPVDGAAGEGFTNTGQALVMSPSLIAKYLDAGKDIASHAVLLPDGLRFSAKATRRDWTEELLAEIRAFYAAYTDPGAADTVVMQGIVLDKNQGGQLPLAKYLAAALELRGGADAATVAHAHGLSPRYLAALAALLNDAKPSPILDGLRARWRAAKPADVPALVAEIASWQKALWKFNSVGHIGKAGGPTSWMEAVPLLAQQQEVKLKLTPPASGNELIVYLDAHHVGDGAPGEVVVWQQPRLVVPGRTPVALKDVRRFVGDLAARRERFFSATAAALAAIADPEAGDPAALAQRHGVDATVLKAWLGYLNLGAETKLGLFTHQSKSAEHAFVTGWDSPDLPALVTNSSDQAVRIPGNLKGHGVVVHPSPTLRAAVGWRSPVTATLRIAGVVTHAHPGCGNGVEWALELRRGATRVRLADGVAQGGGSMAFGPLEHIAVRPGDLVSLLIGPRNHDHSCDLTDLELTLSSDDNGSGAHDWSLTRDVANDVLAGNPHADGAGHAGVWNFYSEPVDDPNRGPVIPGGSLLARWMCAGQSAERDHLATALQALLIAAQPADGADAALHRQLTALGSPLLAAAAGDDHADEAAGAAWGLAAARFGTLPDGGAIPATDLAVRAPAVTEIHLPADLFAGGELITTVTLDATAGAEGSVQVQASLSKPMPEAAELKPHTIVARDGSAARKRLDAVCDEFRAMFPGALCYSKIVPADEVITLTLFYREDQQLARLMLEPDQLARLDRMWDQLRFVSQDALMRVDVFEQLWQFSTQDGDPKVLEPLRKPINDAAAAFRQRLIDTQPAQLDAAVRFAADAWRRPLDAAEQTRLRELYQRFRSEELPHDEAIRLLIARILVAPAFLYHAEKPAPGTKQAPVDDFELASRLSYFLWSSPPDAELRAAAAAGKLRDPEVLAAQAARMQRDPRMRRMATEFACSWLHIHDFDELNEKSERHFPAFIALRGAMYEEAIRFFTDFVQNDRAVPSILDADYAFVNEDLAKFYGIPGVTGAEWRRIDGVRKYGRGGILGLAATLAKQSGASRTSPILRGNWVAEALLGDRLPRPPKDVPPLPEDEAVETLTVRQLTEKHTTDPRCAGCHARINAFGYSLESFDAIGRWRDKDLAGRPIDANTTAMDGSELRGVDGLRAYLLGKRRAAFMHQFCRKLLGYALGRAVQLSDEPLLDDLQARIAAGDDHIGTAIGLIVRSRQFREIRGRDAVFDE